MRFSLALGLAGCIGLSLATENKDGSQTVGGIRFEAKDIIVRDVAILGGGSTGTYSAIRLSQDFNKTVVVVEKNGRLGGHTHTYLDPVTGYPFDYGVYAWHNTPTVTSYFARLGVSLSPVPLVDPFVTLAANLRTGQYLPGGASDPAALQQALGIWFSICAKYPNLQFGYNLTSPVPEELLQPFSTTVTQYGLQALVQFAWTFSHAIGDMMTQPTLYVIQRFGLPQLTTQFISTTDHFNSELYLHAAGALGPNVLYNSTATTIFRDTKKDLQLIVVKNADGSHKLINAKRILVTFVPTLENMAPFSLHHAERSVFKNLIGNPYYAGIIRGGIPDGVSIANVDPTAPFTVPVTPFIQKLAFQGVPGLHLFYAEFPTGTPVTDAQVKDFVLDEVNKVWNKTLAAKPSVEVLANHSPVGSRFAPDEIKAGIYNDMYALQGLKSTFYTGATWAQDDSSLLWQFTDLSVLPLLVGSLG